MRTATVRRALLAWYATEQRDFPWRRTRDPYAVLVSEVMLQQTQARRVAGRFERFVSRFPTLESLAAAPASHVLAEWTGLGYNRRALALQRAAAEIEAAGWPRDVAGLQRLPGVGPYTARAVASLAFGLPVGVVDTNVRRWLMRRYGGHGPRALQGLADALAAGARDEREAASWTHASMEFGAAVCTSRRPRCQACPIARGCPSRGRAPRIAAPRQATYRGSDRALRGALLRCLAAADGHVLPAREAIARATRAREAGDPQPAQMARVLIGLERDALAYRRGDDLVLGVATIAR